ncbi:hypothetical protein HELRODRAFT_166679 [Helobdella robusta]|uniref:Uncharacterized protein n=1 Tax=Helobdella robusta TaxID=6412 RepID=T1EYC7_HELRO|nr:hypothetical protein HELRODRAFT_166679 [Helobdella robusta]ESO11665.1 hypothetical protein HELRODRAFT_166679 [Helobdella robusta]
MSKKFLNNFVCESEKGSRESLHKDSRRLKRSPKRDLQTLNEGTMEGKMDELNIDNANEPANKERERILPPPPPPPRGSHWLSKISTSANHNSELIHLHEGCSNKTNLNNDVKNRSNYDDTFNAYNNNAVTKFGSNVSLNKEHYTTNNSSNSNNKIYYNKAKQQTTLFLLPSPDRISHQQPSKQQQFYQQHPQQQQQQSQHQQHPLLPQQHFLAAKSSTLKYTRMFSSQGNNTTMILYPLSPSGLKTQLMDANNNNNNNNINNNNNVNNINNTIRRANHVNKISEANDHPNKNENNLRDAVNCSNSGSSSNHNVNNNNSSSSNNDDAPSKDQNNFKRAENKFSTMVPRSLTRKHSSTSITRQKVSSSSSHNRNKSRQPNDASNIQTPTSQRAPKVNFSIPYSTAGVEADVVDCDL